MTRTIIEPFRIKVVQPLRFTTREEREGLLEQAHYNPFYLHAGDVLIDLLTDSGTAAMSNEQWAGMMRGDESYAGSESFFRFEAEVKDLTGFRHVIPTHQGRAAERILFSLIGGKGSTTIANTHFDTTRANVEQSGARCVDCPSPESRRLTEAAPFKGNLDLDALEREIEKAGEKNVEAVIVTVTNNSGGGQPVSLANLRAVRRVCDRHGIPLVLDACRFAENAWFIREREAGEAGRTLREIAQEMFRLADICTFSAKKDGLVNMGGFLAMNDDALAARARAVLILTEGFPTYGGLAGRDLEAIAVGLREVVRHEYMAYRVASVRYLCHGLRERGAPVIEPPGGHAAYVDAQATLPHIPREQLPGQALVNALYVVGGVRGVEIGSVMFGSAAQHELVRLAMPRRVYTQSHVDYVLEVFADLLAERDRIPGYKITWEPPYLRHFTAHFEPVG
ncbi:MAG TPA: tryptophanase [Planctomycetota bacterium]|nr:tryptophanase [Planctomycetota bacterium]